MKITLTICLLTGVVVYGVAQEVPDTSSLEYKTEAQSQGLILQQQDRERIQAMELPDDVKRALEGPEYRGWLISGAFRATKEIPAGNVSRDVSATEANDGTIYIVEMKNGGETKTERFTRDGQKLPDR